jgi:hypothetical protein
MNDWITIIDAAGDLIALAAAVIALIAARRGRDEK